jgi:hypothetical protein
VVPVVVETLGSPAQQTLVAVAVVALQPQALQMADQASSSSVIQQQHLLL